MALFKFFKNKKDKNEEEPSLNNLTVQTSDKNNTFENLNPENQISQTEELSEKISDLSKNNLPQSIETIQKNTATEESKKETSKEIIQSLAAEKEKKKGFFAKIKAGLNKTRQNIMSGVEQVLKSFTKIDEELFE